jgi:uncharacterized protein (TIGR02444 family)
MSRHRNSEGLTEFALSLYGRPGVSEICLVLQDEHGADVTLLLFAIWLGARRRTSVTGGRIAEIDTSLHPWRNEVIQPLRGVRRYLKDAGMPRFDAAAEVLRSKVKEAELDAEMIMLSALELLAGSSPGNPGPEGEPAVALVRSNLHVVLEHNGADPSGTRVAPLVGALCAVVEAFGGVANGSLSNGPASA